MLEIERLKGSWKALCAEQREWAKVLKVISPEHLGFPSAGPTVLFACDLSSFLKTTIILLEGSFMTSYLHLLRSLRLPYGFSSLPNVAPKLPARMGEILPWRSSPHLGCLSLWSYDLAPSKQRGLLQREAAKVLAVKSILLQPQASASLPVNFAF